MYKNNSYYETVYNNILDPILLMEGQFFIDANSSALTLFALNSKEDLLLMHPSQLSPEFQPDGELSSIKANKMIKICNNRGQHIFEWLAKSFDDRVFLVEVTLNKITIDNKEVIISKLKNLEIIKEFENKIIKQEKVIKQKELYIEKMNDSLLTSKDNENLLESLVLLEEYKKALDESSIVSKANKSGIINYVNDKFCETSGYSREELIGENHNIIRHPDTPKELFLELWEKIKNKKVFKGIIKNKKKNGQSYYVDSTVIPILDKNNNIIEYIAIRNDITSLFEKDKLIYEQFTDELTFLPNRQKLLNDLKKLINPKLAIINIDRFKDINNSYGIEIGDKILKSVANKLLTFKSTNFNVYRISGDIFAFMTFGNSQIKDLYQTCINLNTLCEKESFIIEDKF